MKKKPIQFSEKVNRIRFTLPDGNVIMNRNVEDWVIEQHSFDPEFIPYTLRMDANIKGVKLVSFTVDSKAYLVDAKVEWR